MDKIYAICYTYGGPYKNIARIEDMVYTTKESCIARLNEIKNALSQLIAVKNGSVYYTVDEENLSVIETWKDDCRTINDYPSQQRMKILPFFTQRSNNIHHIQSY